jgi:hypothetical protein
VRLGLNTILFLIQLLKTFDTLTSKLGSTEYSAAVSRITVMEESWYARRESF